MIKALKVLFFLGTSQSLSSLELLSAAQIERPLETLQAPYAHLKMTERDYTQLGKNLESLLEMIPTNPTLLDKSAVGVLKDKLKSAIDDCKEGLNQLRITADQAIVQGNYNTIIILSESAPFRLRSLHVLLSKYNNFEPLENLIQEIKELDQKIHNPLWEAREKLMKTFYSKAPVAD